MSFKVEDKHKDTLFSTGFTSFMIPNKYFERDIKPLEELTNKLLNNKQLVNIQIDGSDKCMQYIRDYCSELGIYHDINRNTSNITGYHEDLSELNKLVNSKKDAKVYQSWYWYDIEKSRSISHLLVDIYQQFYGKKQVSKTLGESHLRIQLYEQNQHIYIHRDGDYDDDSFDKNCFMLFYYGDWEDGFGGELEVGLGIKKGYDWSNLQWHRVDKKITNPERGRLAILDFSKFNLPHKVHKVLDNKFIRKGISAIWISPKEEVA